MLLVAAPRARRDRVLRILSGAGIDPVEVDAAPLPTVNAVLEAHPAAEDDDGATVVLDLGAHTSVLAAVHAESGLYVRSLECTCEVLTARIREKLGFDRETAEHMLTDLRGEEGRQALGVLDDLVQGLLQEIEETLRFLSVRQRVRKVSRIFLCGGGGLVDGFKAQLGAALGVEVIHPTPLAGAKMTGDRRPAPEDDVRLVGAMGLARW